ncbi:MAG: SpoIID/LytB domain-containing protein [Acidobacteria bacterium]|nr:SpoIID/LytB domain-containing protein [Acidobacteriota bacterium]
MTAASRRTLTIALTVGFMVQGSGFRVRAQNPEPINLRVGILGANGKYSVVTLPLETYVARVIAGEAVRDSQPAALEALAITIRTFALANRGRHRADGFDLCDQTHCQVVRAATPATERAAQATGGRVLLRNGTPASVYFSASCGGRTEIPSDVWPGAEDPPYLPTQDDDACEGAPAWTADLPAAGLLRALRSGGFRGQRLRDLRVTARNASGRVSRLALDGLQPDAISGADLRTVVGRTLGWQHVKSAAFTVRKQGNAFHFSGHGSGHGVGMCVIGSARLAERGTSADQILARYFPGLEISKTTAVITTRVAPTPPPSIRAAVAPRPPAPDVLVSLPDDDEGEHDAILQQTTRARDELARTLGVPAPATLTLRFHPTTDEYEQATGRPWFTSGAFVDGELHLLPLAALRDRGVLEQTIRHELVHLMTEGALAGRPQWVREGAALYFADPAAAPPAGAARPSCPEDNELLRPVSAGALSNAYARARACFARQIQSGKAWRDVK